MIASCSNCGLKNRIPQPHGSTHVPTAGAAKRRCFRSINHST